MTEEQDVTTQGGITVRLVMKCQATSQAEASDRIKSILPLDSRLPTGNLTSGRWYRLEKKVQKSDSGRTHVVL